MALFRAKQRSDCLTDDQLSDATGRVTPPTGASRVDHRECLPPSQRVSVLAGTNPLPDPANPNIVPLGGQTGERAGKPIPPNEEMTWRRLNGDSLNLSRVVSACSTHSVRVSARSDSTRLDSTRLNPSRPADGTDWPPCACQRQHRLKGNCLRARDRQGPAEGEPSTTQLARVVISRSQPATITPQLLGASDQRVGVIQPIAAPVGSDRIAMRPTIGTSNGSRITVAPADLAVASRASTSSTSK